MPQTIELPAPPNRILLIKPSALGDIVHTLPVLGLLKRRWPDARISWLVASNFAGLIDQHPLLDEVIRFDRHRLASAWWNPKALVELIRFGGDLRRHHFDLVIDLQGLLRSGFTARAARSPFRVGFANAREGAPMFYTHRVHVPTMDSHALDRYLLVTDALGCDRANIEFILPTNDEDHAAVEAKLPRDISKFAVLLPATNWPTKRWPVEHFAALVAPLRERFGLSSVIAGGRDAIELARQIPGAHDLTDQTSLRQLVALLSRASLVIANDSGPMHIAAALGRPLVTVFGPTNPARTGPFGRDDTVLRVDIPCSPCYSRTCCHTSCMKWVTPRDVIELAEMQLRMSNDQASMIKQ